MATQVETQAPPQVAQTDGVPPAVQDEVPAAQPLIIEQKRPVPEAVAVQKKAKNKANKLPLQAGVGVALTGALVGLFLGLRKRKPSGKSSTTAAAPATSAKASPRVQHSPVKGGTARRSASVKPTSATKKSPKVYMC